MLISAAFMFRRFAWALRHARREEELLPVLGSGASLVLVGTVVYMIGEGWSVADGFYFAVGTLTTWSIADP